MVPPPPQPGMGYPRAGQDGGTLGWSNPPRKDSRASTCSAAAVCLLCSRRRTFLFDTYFQVDPYDMTYIISQISHVFLQGKRRDLFFAKRVRVILIQKHSLSDLVVVDTQVLEADKQPKWCYVSLKLYSSRGKILKCLCCCCFSREHNIHKALGELTAGGKRCDTPIITEYDQTKVVHYQVINKILLYSTTSIYEN